MTGEFSATDEHVDDRTHVVVVAGEIDIFTAPEFKGVIGAAIDGGPDTVIIDLEGATFIDSSSLGVLISAHRRMTQREGRLVVATNVPAVRKTFEITGLDSVLEVVDSRAEALSPNSD